MRGDMLSSRALGLTRSIINDIIRQAPQQPLSCEAKARLVPPF
jgi:hypothetical protein